MKQHWYFPPGNPGDKEGFNDTGMSHFDDNFQLHTARETIQNVLDARQDKDKPAIVRFKLISVPIDEAIPEKDNFENIIRENIESNRGDGKIFFKKALSILKQKYIDIMIISDENTKGVTGINTNKDYTRWDNLILRRGSSESQGPVGGTYGIGKHAPFGCSLIRTILYYTETIDSEVGYIWNSIFTSHGTPIKASRGKYCITNDEKDTMNAIQDKSKRPNFIDRNLPGTDLCIIGFEMPDEAKQPWNVQFHKKIMDSYFVSIYDNELTVEFVDAREGEELKYQINNKNIYDKMETDSLDNSNKFHLLDAYVNHDKIFEKEIQHIDKCKFYIKLNDTYDKSIGKMRQPKMLVFDEKNRILNRGYSGIFICNNNNGNNQLKDHGYQRMITPREN